MKVHLKLHQCREKSGNLSNVSYWYLYWGENITNGTFIFSSPYIFSSHPHIHMDDKSIGTFLWLPESSDPGA